MIEARIDKENENDYIEASGTLMDIVEGTGWMIALIYKMIREKDPEASEKFREAITMAVAGEGSPLWQPDEQEPLS